MRVEKQFKFYAAHRNEELIGKCSSLHGHRYGLAVVVEYPKVDGISILFDELEQSVAPLIEQLDHSLLLHSNDPARGALRSSGACGKIVELPFVTSAENLTDYIWDVLRNQYKLNVVQLRLQETDSSTVIKEL